MGVNRRNLRQGVRQVQIFFWSRPLTNLTIFDFSVTIEHFFVG